MEGRVVEVMYASSGGSSLTPALVGRVASGARAACGRLFGWGHDWGQWLATVRYSGSRQEYGAAGQGM